MGLKYQMDLWMCEEQRQFKHKGKQTLIIKKQSRKINLKNNNNNNLCANAAAVIA